MITQKQQGNKSGPYATSPKTHQVEKQTKQKPGCHLGKVLEKVIYPFYPLKTNI